MKVFIGDNFYQPALVKIKDLNYGGNSVKVSVKVSEAKEAGVDLKDVNTEEVTEKEEMKEEVESKYSGLPEYKMYDSNHKSDL